jgi:hypothetical protein
MLTTTVRASGVSMLETPLHHERRVALPVFSRSKVHLTSSASTGLPSEKTGAGSR